MPLFRFRPPPPCPWAAAMTYRVAAGLLPSCWCLLVNADTLLCFVLCAAAAMATKGTGACLSSHVGSMLPATGPLGPVASWCPAWDLRDTRGGRDDGRRASLSFRLIEVCHRAGATSSRTSWRFTHGFASQSRVTGFHGWLSKVFNRYKVASQASLLELGLAASGPLSFTSQMVFF